MMLNRQRNRLFAAIVVAILIIAAIFTIPRIARFASDVIGIPSEAYASDWTAVFVIEHLRTSGTWPTGWDDLEDEFDKLAVPNHYAWTFAELQTLIDVDWDTTVSDIRDSETPPQLVRLNSGRSLSYNGDPSLLIYNYIKTGDDPHRIRERIGMHAENAQAGG